MPYPTEDISYHALSLWHPVGLLCCAPVGEISLQLWLGQEIMENLSSGETGKTIHKAL